MEYLYVGGAIVASFGLGVGFSTKVKAGAEALVNKGLDWLKSKV